VPAALEIDAENEVVWLGGLRVGWAGPFCSHCRTSSPLDAGWHRAVLGPVAGFPSGESLWMLLNSLNESGRKGKGCGSSGDGEPILGVYRFACVRQTLRVTLAMKALLSDYVWSIEELVALLSRRSAEAA
jgi:hypothetical protein